MVLVPTLISQQDNWPAILRDEQVGRTIAVVITGDDGPRLFESDLVEADVGGDIFESVWAEIAKQPHFALAIGGFANRNQVNPAVIVVIDGSDAPSREPSWSRAMQFVRRSSRDCYARELCQVLRE